MLYFWVASSWTAILPSYEVLSDFIVHAPQHATYYLRTIKLFLTPDLAKLDLKFTLDWHFWTCQFRIDPCAIFWQKTRSNIFQKCPNKKSPWEMKAKTQSGQIIKGMKQQQLKFIVTADSFYSRISTFSFQFFRGRNTFFLLCVNYWPSRSRNNLGFFTPISKL